MKQFNSGEPASRHPGWIIRLLVACGTLTGSVGAMAAASGFYGTLTYAPLGGSGPAAATPTAIPTMGAVGLVLLSAFLLLVFWRLHRSGATRGGRFMVAALVSGALASGLGGVKLVSDTMADISWGIFLDMTNPNGGTLTLNEGQSFDACVRNKTEEPMRITAMEVDMNGAAIGVTSPSESPECVAPETPEATMHAACTVEMVLQPEDICGVTLGFYPAT